MDPFFIVAIGFIIVLVAIRIFLRRRGSGLYIEILQTMSHTFSLPPALKQQLSEEGIRYRTVRKGGANIPFAPLAGPQIVALEVHIEDLERGRRIVSKLQNKTWRGRT